MSIFTKIGQTSICLYFGQLLTLFDLIWSTGFNYSRMGKNFTLVTVFEDEKNEHITLWDPTNFLNWFFFKWLTSFIKTKSIYWRLNGAYNLKYLEVNMFETVLDGHYGIWKNIHCFPSSISCFRVWFFFGRKHYYDTTSVY